MREEREMREEKERREREKREREIRKRDEKERREREKRDREIYSGVTYQTPSSFIPSPPSPSLSLSFPSYSLSAVIVRRTSMQMTLPDPSQIAFRGDWRKR